MSWVNTILFVAAMVALVDHYRRLLFAGAADFSGRRQVKWMVAGLVLPLGAWMLLNAGSRPVLPPLVPMMPPAGAGWFGNFVFQVRYLAAQTRPAAFVVSSFWAAVSLAWYVVVMSGAAPDRREFVVTCVAWCGLLLPMVALLLYWFGPVLLGVAALFWVWPLAHHAISLKPVPRPPLYARAVAKMQFGKYREAEQAIIGELEKCETDFDGWIMLASLYARQFHDLPEAERTIREICNEPGTTPSQVAIALNQMADWHLQVNADPVAARRALDEIVRRLPNTLLAWTAALRGQQLPATAAEWKEQQQARKFPLLPLSDQLDDRGAGTEPDPHDPAARALAERCIEKLKQDPNDVEVREQLALVLADQMGALGLAIDQINLLMEMPGQSAARFPGWLALMAGWEIRRGTNLDAARELLRRLIREHPDSVQAFAAQRRLKLLDMDEQIAKSGTAARGPVGAARPG